MKQEIHKASTRGHANHGWLDSHHSFSFAHYYNPERMRFGLLRVLNDDVVSKGAGFGTHPHDNMEIVSIPLKGALAHRDSTGTEEVINTNDVQIMSTGSGLSHSEYNASKDDFVNFLQLWVLPKERNIIPRYDQKTFLPETRENKWQVIVAPDNKEALWINQDAWFSLGKFDSDKPTSYKINKAGNGVYLFLIEGSIELNGEKLEKRDAIGLQELDLVDIKVLEKCEILAVEVPMG
jgi:quercetin 2,3-dioxygenase